MKIDLDWIQKELDAGREVELECVDREGYEKRHLLNKTLFREGSCLEVLEILANGAINLKRLSDSFTSGLHLISPHEFKHFSIKRKSPTFSDLMRVVSKAKDDGIIKDFSESVRIYWNDSDLSSPFSDSDLSINNAINKINSLYTETFVIESEEDCKKIKQNAKITFLNGNSVVMDNPPTDDGIVRIWNDGRYDFTVLKGATVTQKRS